MKTSRRAFLANIMRDAWTLARQGAERFGGSVRLYFAFALRLVWQDSRPRAVWHPKQGNRFWLPGVPLAASRARTGQMFLPGVSVK